jgi:hypothetical protein
MELRLTGQFGAALCIRLPASVPGAALVADRALTCKTELIGLGITAKADVQLTGAEIAALKEALARALVSENGYFDPRDETLDVTFRPHGNGSVGVRILFAGFDPGPYRIEYTMTVVETEIERLHDLVAPLAAALVAA